MLWVIDNSCAKAESGYHVHSWLRSADIPFQIVTELSQVIADSGARVIISGGPKYHDQVPELYAIVRPLMEKSFPTLGICLGCFVMADILGVELKPSARGAIVRTVNAFHIQEALFAGLVSPIEIAVSHGEYMSRNAWPKKLIIDAVSSEGDIIAWHHDSQPFYGVAFHPEHAHTIGGSVMLKNFLH